MHAVVDPVVGSARSAAQIVKYAGRCAVGQVWDGVRCLGRAAAVAHVHAWMDLPGMFAASTRKRLWVELECRGLCVAYGICA